MTSREWLEHNPDIDKETIVNELIEWRQRADIYKKQYLKLQTQLAEIKYVMEKHHAKR